MSTQNTDNINQGNSLYPQATSDEAVVGNLSVVATHTVNGDEIPEMFQGSYYLDSTYNPAFQNLSHELALF